MDEYANISTSSQQSHAAVAGIAILRAVFLIALKVSWVKI